ncbi:penicillin-binding protein activator [Sansalvadorimonas verongulae]|uniref:penicillin-binding protein activator n=1 Tax=Sansalvadorimonas verongulae TaxID=2172824 RepID=UPI0012BCDEA4|nr:penicillin-binding protein activator [Sansalvadorimonas verongulae]MTI15253.1 hypothetical protein [Sansalvadorimonas verongulae]
MSQLESDLSNFTARRASHIVNLQSWARILLLALPVTILTACSSAPTVDSRPKAQQSTAATSGIPDINDILTQAARAKEPLQSQLYLQAADHFKVSDTARAADMLQLIDTLSLTFQQQNQFRLISARIQLKNNITEDVQRWLNTINRSALTPPLQYEFDTIKAQLADIEGRYSDAIKNWGLAASNPVVEPTPELFKQLWKGILQEENEDISALLKNNTNRTLQPWLELALIYRSPSELNAQLVELKQWEQRWSGTPAQLNMPAAITTLQHTSPYEPRRIALLLPLSGPQASAGQAVRDGFMASYYQSLHNSQSNPKYSRTLPEIVLYDTANSKASSILAQQAQEEGAEMIIGPLRRSVASQNLKDSNVTVPWLVLNQVGEQPETNPVYQFGLASESEAIQAAERAWEDGYRNPIIMTPDTSWGKRVADSFSSTWEELGGQVLSHYTFNNTGDYNTSASEALLVNASFKRANNLTRLIGERLDYTPRRRNDADMIFMAGSPTQGRQLKPALDFYFAYNLPVYTVSTMYSGQQDVVQDRDLNDVRIPLMPWFVSRSSPLKRSIQNTWKTSKSQLAPLYALGSDTWRIYPRLEQMSKSEGAELFGATGILTIPPSREVKRELSWQYFRNGRPVALSKEVSMHPERSQNVLENEG